MNRKRARLFDLLPVVLVFVVGASTALGQEGSAAEQPAEPKPAGESKPESKPASKPESLAFGTDLGGARERARAEGKPMLVVAVPDWYENPGWTRLRDEILTRDEGKQKLAGFVRVLVEETRDREVHVRHRLRYRGYPLAVLMGPDGDYLGHVSGLPADSAPRGWVERVAAIPARAKRMKELRTALEAAPEDPGTLFELAGLHVEAGEADRADALYERMERADPLGPADRLGEARYQRLRGATVKALEGKRFADVESYCRKWLRRFDEHVRAPDVLLLQANARFLAGDKDGAVEVWDAIVASHADTEAAKSATACKKKLAK